MKTPPPTAPPPSARLPPRMYESTYSMCTHQSRAGRVRRDHMDMDRDSCIHKYDIVIRLTDSVHRCFTIRHGRSRRPDAATSRAACLPACLLMALRALHRRRLHRPFWPVAELEGDTSDQEDDNFRCCRPVAQVTIRASSNFQSGPDQVASTHCACSYQIQIRGITPRPPFVGD